MTTAAQSDDVSPAAHSGVPEPVRYPGAADADEVELDDLRLLYECSRRISAAVDIPELVVAYLEQFAVGNEYACTVAVDEWSDTGQRIGMIIHARWLPGTGMVRTGERHPYDLALDSPARLLEALDAGRTVTIDDVASDPRVSPRLRELQLQTGRPALAMVPLIARGQRIGLVIMSRTAAHAWGEEELRPYQTTAAQLAAALDTRLQLHLLAERDRQVAVLEERQRIARDLHDSVTQLLFSMSLLAQTLAAAWQRDPAEGEQRATRLLELSRTALREMRGMLTELHAAPEAATFPEAASSSSAGRVRRDGLPQALRAHLAEVQAEGIETVLDATRYTAQSPEVEDVLFHIVQEALNNTIKHARARRVTVRLGVRSGSIEVSVGDNGAGFAPGEEISAAQGRLGLAIMRERAAALGGRVRVRSTPGRGTTVVARLPAAGGGAS